MDVKVINVFYWQVNKPDGSNPDHVIDFEQDEACGSNSTTDTLLDGIRMMNIDFGAQNIYFKYQGWDSFNSPEVVTCGDLYDPSIHVEDDLDPDGFYTLALCQKGNMWSWAKENGYWKDDAINVYVPYTTDGFSGASRGIISNQLVVHRFNVDNRIMVHEMGHALGLRHTNQGYAVAFDSSPINDENCEHVTRDESDPLYNADEKGDLITDTAAVPDFREEYCRYTTSNASEYASCRSNTPNNYFYIDAATCAYTGTNKDCIDVPFDIYQEDTRNIMSYSRGSCINQFSAGQGIHMLETIEEEVTAAMNGQENEIGGAVGTVESLYEPFMGSYYFAGPIDLDEHIPYLQPGISYTFVTCEGYYPEPSDYTDTSFTYSNSGATTHSKYCWTAPIHENHTAIIIPDIDPQVRRCYNNYNRTPVGGKVTRFNDGTFNYNITETPKDSLGINDNNLIQNLNPGLYKIEKNLPGGYIEEEVIQKYNND